MLSIGLPINNSSDHEGLTYKRVDYFDWTDLANCKGKLKLFFAPNAERPQARERREAKARTLCNECPVQQCCSEFAREHHEYGYWGGESEEKRHLAGYTISAPIGIRTQLHQTAQLVKSSQLKPETALIACHD